MEGEVFVTASIGIALSGSDGDTPETLLRNADAAMYRAKERGRDRAELFDASEHHRAVDDLRTGNELHRAIERGELRVHYQPMIDLAAGTLFGFEALIRWEHPERGLVPPMEFVPLAEETGLIVPARCVGARAGVSAGGALARRVARRPAAVDEREPLAAPAGRAGLAQRRGARAPRHRHPAVGALARDHREHADARRGVGAQRARRARKRSACTSRSTTSAPGYSSLAYLERLPGRGAQDRPLVHQRRRASARTAPRSSARSSGSPAPCGCRRWPKESRPASSSSTCGRWGAKWVRASCSGRRGRPRCSVPTRAVFDRPRRRRHGRLDRPRFARRRDVVARVRTGFGSLTLLR